MVCFGYFPCWNALNTPLEIIFKLRTKCWALCLPSNQSINHKIELYQKDFVLFPSTAWNMPNGVTNTPTSTGSKRVSHPPPPTFTPTHSPQQRNWWWLTLNGESPSYCRFWLCFVYWKAPSWKLTKVGSLSYIIDYFSFATSWSKNNSFKPDDNLRSTDKGEQSLRTRRNLG